MSSRLPICVVATLAITLGSWLAPAAPDSAVAQENPAGQAALPSVQAPAVDAEGAVIAPVENGWDFTAPNGVPGFGPLPDGTDMEALLRQATGQPSSDQVPTETTLAAPRMESSTSMH